MKQPVAMMMPRFATVLWTTGGGGGGGALGAAVREGAAAPTDSMAMRVFSRRSLLAWKARRGFGFTLEPIERLGFKASVSEAELSLEMPLGRRENPGRNPARRRAGDVSVISQTRLPSMALRARTPTRAFGSDGVAPDDETEFALRMPASANNPEMKGACLLLHPILAATRFPTAFFLCALSHSLRPRRHQDAASRV